MHVDEVALSKEEIVHDKRPDGAEVVIEKIRNDHLTGTADNKKQLRRQKTREKLILARDVIKTKSSSTNW